MNKKQYYVYIMASNSNSTIYIGITNDLIRRVEEHKNNVVEGFTQKYKVHKLVYFEIVDDPYAAITREKQLKGWIRAKKNALISSVNPRWEDLSLKF